MTTVERGNTERESRRADFWREKYLEAHHVQIHQGEKYQGCRFCKRAQELLELLFVETEKARGEEP